MRIYLGAAPGVGKTYAMLAEGQRRRARGTDVVVGFVETHGLTGHDRPALGSQRALLESLGGGYHQIVGNDVATALLQFAQAQNTTQIVLGASRRGALASLLSGEGLGSRVIRLSGPIDVHVVTHQFAAGPLELRLPRAARGLPARRSLAGLALAALLLPARVWMEDAEHLRRAPRRKVTKVSRPAVSA